MHSQLRGSSALADNDSDAFIKLTVDGMGRVIVLGRVGGTHADHHMNFEFTTDQTCLRPLARDLDYLLRIVPGT